MKTSDLTRLLGDRPFWKQTLALGIPVALQNLLSASFSMVDTVMVSQLGGDGLSAVGMAGQWSWFFVTLLFGFTSGAAVLQSQYWGARNETGIRRVATVALLGSLLCLLPFFLLSLFAPRLVISFFNSDPAILDIGGRYLRIALWSYPALAMNGVLAATLRSVGQVKLPMVASLLSAALNVLCNYCLIFGAGPIPALGIEGAAIATVISAWFGPVLLLLVSILRKNVLCGSLRSYFGLSRGEVTGAMRRILPVVGNEVLYGLAALVLTMILSNLGKDEYGGVTIFNSVSNLVLSFYQGICSACCITVGTQVGAGRIREAVRDAKRFSLIAPMLSLFLGMGILLFRGPIVLLFGGDGGLSEVTVATAHAILLFYGLEIALRNIPNLQIIGILRAGGNVSAAALFDLVCLWGLVIPVALLTSYLGLPLFAVFVITYLCEDVSKTVLCLIFFFKEKWLMPVTEEGRAALAAYRAEGQSAKTQGKNA